MEQTSNINTTYLIVACFLVLAFVVAAVIMIMQKKRRREHFEQRAQSYVAALNELVAGNNTKAMELFKEAVRFDTNNIDAYLKLGMLFRLEKNPSRALKIHKELIIRSGLERPLRLELFRNIVDDLTALGQYNEALEYCEKILSLEPRHPWALEMQPLIYEKMKDWRNAFKTLKSNRDKSEEREHRLALYKVAHGKKLMDSGEFHDARLFFKEAVKLDRSFPAPYLYLGDAYAREDRRDDAVKVWREFADAVPEKSYLIFDYLDSAYFEAGNYGAMEVFLTKIIEKDPDNYLALLRLGEIYFKKGDKDKAFEMTERSMKVNPKSPEALGNLIMYLNNSTDLQVIKDKATSLAKLVAEPSVSKCVFCGYKSSEILIQCPSCDALDAFEF